MAIKSKETINFEIAFDGHKPCLICGHEIGFHELSDWKGNLLNKPICCAFKHCLCGKEPNLPHGYFEIERKTSAAMVADIVLGKNSSGEASSWATMRYNPSSGIYNRVHFFIGLDSEQRARKDFE
jgi:hypothetical protein